MAGAAVGSLLENLKGLIRYNYDLFPDIEEHVNNLGQELAILKAFLEEYTEKYGDNENLQSLAKEIRQVVYQAEDAIDTYIAFSSRQNSRGVVYKALHAVDHALELRKVGKDLEAIREKLQKLHQKSGQLGFVAMRSEGRSPKGGESTRKALMVEEDNVVGFDDEVEQIIDLLIRESEQLEVISIIGMLGLGKTTLAKKVFNDPRIEYEFYPRAFVHVSQEYKRKEVFLNILGAFTPITDEMNNLSDEILAETLQEKLQVRKYLIVMDDIWTPEAWDDLKVVLPTKKKCGKVLITTRNKLVASFADPRSVPYNLRYRNSEESRELLRRKVFGENNCPEELHDYESRIIQKCDGLPLAIVVVAGILLNHRERTDWWSKVADDASNIVALNQEQNSVIKLSFNHLPYHLKACFLYLGVFHEDSEIPVGKLLQLWIAEGFVESDDGTSMEDIAEDYLEDLVARNLVMVGQRRLNGQIKTCHIPGILRDFCKEEAIKENLFQEIKRFDQATISSAYPSCRRIVINSSVSEYVASKPSSSHVRSFLSFAPEEMILPMELVSSIPKAFKLLRVLDVRPIIFTRFPLELLYLVLLKYIAISCHFKILPEKMSNLRNLQTVVIETSSRTLEIKADIWKMAQLRHLYTNASTFLPKVKGEWSAESLQTLATISPESCRKEVFERTPKLKKLVIHGNLGTVIEVNGESSLFDCLAKLEFLENLKLLNDDLLCSLRALPHESNFPRRLKRLTLLNTLLDWKYMSTLGKLENLEVLKLKDNAFQGEFWQTEDGGFRCLRVLQIGSTNLVVWQAMASHFPMLSSLFLRHCNDLEAIPPSLGDIPSLQNIDLYCTNMSVASSARKIQLLKLEVQAQRWNSRNSGFRLSVYPPDQ